MISMTFAFATAAEAKAFLASIPDGAQAVPAPPPVPAATAEKPARRTRTAPVTEAEIDKAAAETAARAAAKASVTGVVDPAPAPAPAPAVDAPPADGADDAREKARDIVFALAKAGKRDAAVALIRKFVPEEVEKPGVKDIADGRIVDFYNAVRAVQA